ncbi:MAG TPA: hypothetical protein VEL07_11970 [Planctomycetota bacterium]|nr:hypothetical protein [Planctomycetota bacterium]
MNAFSSPADALRAARRLMLALLLAGAWSAPAAELSDQQVLDIVTSEDARDRAIRRALAFLRSQSQPDHGMPGGPRGALTGLALIAHLAAGVTPEDPEHGAWIRHGLEFILGLQSANGYLGEKDASRMYGHGIMTLCLAEALGMSRDDDLEERLTLALTRAVAVTINAAQITKAPAHEGGWRYLPGDAGADLSLSGWQLMSLHATQQVGVPVPEAVILAAVAYAKRLTSADGRVGYESPGQDNPSLRGLSMLSLSIGGQGDAPEVAAVTQRILADPIKWQGQWFFYRAYYDAVGMSRAAPAAWDGYSRQLEQVLVERQNPDGTWSPPPGNNEGDYGPIYMTSMGVLALAVQRHVLPAYQR